MNSRTAKLLLVILTVFMTVTIINVIIHIFKNDYVTETAVEFSASNSITFKGVYVRDEQVINYDGNGVISYAVNDGGKLGSDETVAYVYSDENQIEINEKINNIKSEIAVLEKIQNPGTQEVSQPSYLASLIDEKYNDIVYHKEKGDLTKLATVREEFLIYLSTMQYVTKEVSDFSKKIASLEAEMSALESQSKGPVQEIKSPQSAYFASYVDGYEDVLTFEKIDQLTASQINSISDYNEKDLEKPVVGKLINGYKWKIVGVIKDTQNFFKKDDEITLFFPLSEKTVKSTIENIREADNQNEKIITIVCSEMSYDFVQHRVETVEIQDKEHKGIRIPRDAIRLKELTEKVVDPQTKEVTNKKVPTRGVYVKLGEKIVFKKIDVDFEGEDYVISKINPGNDYVQLYDDTIVGGLSLK